MERYDYESGLVFRETIFKPGPRSKAWEYRCLAAKPKYTPPSRGAETLYAKAMREIVRNAHTLSPETLQAVPTSIVQQIWKTIRRGNRESLNIWKIFVGGEHRDHSFMHSAHLFTHMFTKPIVDYFADITSTSCTWMTDLCLTDVKCSVSDLKQLSTLVSLQNLQIFYSKADNSSVFDEKILNHWALCARGRGAFHCLEMIVVLNAPRITVDSFHCLNDFPALDAFVLYNTAVKQKHAKQAKRFGWLRSLDGEFCSFIDTQNLKAAYECSKSYWKLRPTKLIMDYIHFRRSKNKNDQVPVLSVEFSERNNRKAWLDSDLTEFQFFERDWKSSKFHLEERTASSPTTEKQPPGMKKRKLKDGKALELNNILATF